MNAFRAGDLIESFGVNTHFRSQTYKAKFGQIVASLKELGVRYIREGLESDQVFLTSLALVNLQTGARFELVTEPRNYTVGDAIRLISSNISMISAVEGINEADGWFKTQVPDWVGATIAHQTELYRALKVLPVLRDLPVYSPTVINAASAQLIANLPADYGAYHCYFGSRHPETGGWGSSTGGVPYGRTDYGAVNMANVTCPGKPVVVTETGYYTGTTGDRVNEDLQAKYFPRLLLQNFAAGIARTACYEFFDEGIDKTNREQNFGLIRNDCSPKPVFNVLKNLFTALRDSGTFTPGSLNFSIVFAPPDMRTVLFQKRCGTFFLAYWLARPSQDPVTLAPINVAPAPFSLTLDSKYTVQTLRPIDGTTWKEVASDPAPAGKAWHLTATDHMRLARIA